MPMDPKYFTKGELWFWSTKIWVLYWYYGNSSTHRYIYICIYLTYRYNNYINILTYRYMNIQSVRLWQVSDSIESVGHFPSIQKYWWLSTIRESLWMTVTTASKRAWVSPSAWITAEKREVEWTISLETLRKFLAALNCDLAYMPVPRIRPLSQMVEKQAFEFTRREMMAIDSTMALENQAPTEEFIEKMIKNKSEDIIRNGNWKKIWQ